MDGKIDRREQAHLLSILGQLAGNPDGFSGGFALATDLPVTDPEPEVVFEDRTFVFAGSMAYGPPHACEREVLELGGRCDPSVTRRTDYVVIGSIAAADWRQADFGGALDEVAVYATRGVQIRVVTEEAWAAALPQGA